MQDISINIAFVKKVLANAPSAGCDTALLLQRSRIPPRLLDETQARVDAQQFARLQTVTMREMSDEMLGYCTRPLQIGHWSALSHWLVHCKTLGQALKRYRLFYDMLERGLKIGLAVERDTVRIRFTPWGHETRDLDPYAYEMFMFNFHRLLRVLTESNLPLEQVGLHYPPTDTQNEYRHIFLGAPITFNTEHCFLVLQRKYLSLPIKLNYEGLAKFLRNPLYNLLVNPYHSKSWSQRVSEIVRASTHDIPRFESIAETLDINPKKLSRLLEQEGIKYSDLKLELRRDLAIAQLSKRETSIEEIAFMTGFSESSAFIRAFKKWTGVTPYTYRKGFK